MSKTNKIGLGGGCHWCTEGVFQSLVGVKQVDQGWIASQGEDKTFSEAVIVHFDSTKISLNDLIEIHLYTHSSTSNHSMRKKYRSAVYVFSKKQKDEAAKIIRNLQNEFDDEIITQVLFYTDFKLNKEDQLNYFYSRPENSFCKSYIHPKLRFLLKKFTDKIDPSKIKELENKKIRL